MSEHVTYCRLCDCHCGLIATVENDEIVKLMPDPDHPVTQGFSCPKGLAMREVTHDPERILHPLRKGEDDSFEQVSWDTAIKEIGERLNQIRADHGNDAIGLFEGNATNYSYSAGAWLRGMVAALDTPHLYTTLSMDASPRLVASRFMYGSLVTVPSPDINHTDFMLNIGANPVASHGSAMGNIKARKAMNAIVDRGGRVVVVDPRRTETAVHYEHLPIQPNGDAFLILSMLHVIFEAGVDNLGAAESYTSQLEALKEAVKPYPPEVTSQHTGVAAPILKQLALDFAQADSACAYSRIGACLSGFGTLVTFLVDTLNVVTGNVDSRGGVIFGSGWIDFEDFVKSDDYGARKSRIGGFPIVAGGMPCGIMADEINTPGKGQLRSLIVMGANPAVSIPGSNRVKEALQNLDLLVSLDLNFTDTNRMADYILPAATLLEREDPHPAMKGLVQQKPFLQWSEPVISPRGEARQEWTIIRDICAELNIVPSQSPMLRRLGWLGRKVPPKFLFDFMLRMGPWGDRFGLRPKGLSVKKLIKEHPRGNLRGDRMPVGVLPERLRHDDKRLHLFCDEIAAEIQRLNESVAAVDEAYPFRMFGRREIRKLNSGLKNAPLLRAGELGPACIIHPEDAKRLGLSEGELGRVSSPTGSIEARFQISDDVIPGAVSIPHGWSPLGVGQKIGAVNEPFNANELTVADAQTLDPLSGNAVANGIRVQIEALNDYRKVAN